LPELTSAFELALVSVIEPSESGTAMRWRAESSGPYQTEPCASGPVPSQAFAFATSSSATPMSASFDSSLMPWSLRSYPPRSQTAIWVTALASPSESWCPQMLVVLGQPW
jgi:hypothetical protein